MSGLGVKDKELRKIACEGILTMALVALGFCCWFYRQWPH